MFTGNGKIVFYLLTYYHSIKGNEEWRDISKKEYM
jgi:hypothetical protein